MNPRPLYRLNGFDTLIIEPNTAGEVIGSRWEISLHAHDYVSRALQKSGPKQVETSMLNAFRKSY